MGKHTVSKHGSVEIVISEKPVGNDHVECVEQSDDDEDASPQLSPEEKRKLLWKLDIRILPVVITLSLLSSIDRSNIGNAKIEGMKHDLHLTGTQYNIVLSIFFVTYIIFQIPSTYIMERYFERRPSLWIGIIAVAWGTAMTLHGIVRDFKGLLAARLCMGIFEAGLGPTIILVLNKWYGKYELATRFGLHHCGAALAGSFSGLLAYALTKMDGMGGIEGWRWIFIMEGAFTIAVGAITPLILANPPENPPKWLSIAEAKFLAKRLFAKDGGERIHSASKSFSFSLLWSVIRDWQFYPMLFVYWSDIVPIYGMKFTLPTIIKNMGFTSSHAQLLTIPPYVAGALSAYAFGRLSDRFRKRAHFLVIPQTLVVISYGILIAFAPKISKHIGICFFAVTLANIGFSPISPGANSWISNNLAGPNKRAIGIAWMTSLNNLGGIFASFMFVEKEKPGYPTGFGTSLGFAFAGILAVLVLETCYTKINKRRAHLSEEDVRRMYTDEDLAALGDRSPLYKYAL